jgi:6-phosphogluconolactonase (cycloisomerase 2 family)
MTRFSAVVLICLSMATITWMSCGGNATTAPNAPTAPTTSSPSPTSPTPPTPAPPTTPPPPTPPPAPTPTPSSAATFVYVANNGSAQHVGGSISGFAIDAATGNLKAVPGSPFTAGDGPSAIGSDSQGHFVFVAEDQTAPGARGSNCTLFHSTILAEAVDPASGALTRRDRKTLDGVCARSIVVDPDSKHVYIGMQRFGASNGEIQGFAIGSAGTLTELPGSPFFVDGFPTGLVMHPNGKFIYAASDSGLLELVRDPATGTLVERGAFNTPKRNLALNPAGTFLAATELNTNEVSEFFVDANTGDIAATEGRAQASNPSGIAADPLGKFFAVTEETDTTTFASGVSTFVLDSATHELVKTSGSPFSSGSMTIDVAFDPSGSYLYAVNRQDVSGSGSGTVSGFVVDRLSGALKPVPGVRFGAGDFPDALTVVKPR